MAWTQVRQGHYHSLKPSDSYWTTFWDAICGDVINLPEDVERGARIELAGLNEIKRMLDTCILKALDTTFECAFEPPLPHLRPSMRMMSDMVNNTFAELDDSQKGTVAYVYYVSRCRSPALAPQQQNRAMYYALMSTGWFAAALNKKCEKYVRPPIQEPPKAKQKEIPMPRDGIRRPARSVPESKLTTYKLVVLGDGGVGKTALTIQLCLNHFVETYDPTIEDSYPKQVQIDQQSYQWIRDGEGFVLVYSISSRSSFARVQDFHRQIQRVKESSLSGSPTYPSSPLSTSSNGSGFGLAPIMLVGNKCDRETEREVSTQEGSALARELGCNFLETSAKNCVNVEKAFYDVVRQLRRQRQQYPAANEAASANNTNTTSRDYFSCVIM
ncbi:ras-domain-containing protein [Mytilinidion resinicola]|uniref:Ras-domain-containing protein n=1 Tax=Mytilinidion resinicola TaxID=574789 RepID=A0A6A6YHN3_9PEZI|nr:ras-domain-containing protein [Mytilinidion resinicola]KAF2807514.1 ras-domain-containing protein [Mytilinidion resinicola]